MKLLDELRMRHSGCGDYDSLGVDRLRRVHRSRSSHSSGSLACLCRRIDHDDLTPEREQVAKNVLSPAPAADKGDSVPQR